LNSKKPLINVAVIGGGAAGFFSAIKCAETNPKARVTIYEKGAHVLTKVRISGGGRCNVTHSCFDPKALVTHYPRGHRELLGPFHKFQPRDTVKWFESRGVALKTEDDGRLFPTTDASITIINALKDAADKAGVTVRTQASPASVTTESPRAFRIVFSSGETATCQRLLLASGSGDGGYALATSLGHTLEAPVPSLFTFNIPDKRLRDLSGISVESAEIKIIGTDLKQKGPVLITHWGLSGPAVLKLSAWGARVLYDKQYQARVQVNWLGIDRGPADEKIRHFKKNNAKKSIPTHSPFPIPQRLWERLSLSSGLTASDIWADLSNVQIDKLLDALCASSYALSGKSTFKDEFVTCGGVRLDEVDFTTMESKRCPGLYFAGEILDIDGVTGGFNFQSAWTTGWLAGQAMGGE
jgi:predicted Rossmann fold flavoprotein